MKQQDRERQAVADAEAPETTRPEEKDSLSAVKQDTTTDTRQDAEKQKSDRFVSSEQQTGSDSADRYADHTTNETDQPNQLSPDNVDKAHGEKRNEEERETETPDASVNADSRSEEERLEEEYRLMGEDAPGGEKSIDDVLKKLSTFSTQTKKDRLQRRYFKRQATHRRRWWILILALIAGLGVVTWALFLAGGDESGDRIATRELFTPQDLLPASAVDRAAGKCETLADPDAAQSIMYIFAPVSQSEVQSIAWRNSEGSYEIYRDNEGNFVMRDAEDNSYVQQRLSMLVAATCRPSVLQRVTTACEDFSEYGLTPGKEPMSYTVTTTANVTHTVLLGDKTPAGTGYYVRYEGRDAVYVIPADYIDTCIAQPMATMMTPLLVYPVPENEYYLMDNFTLKRHGEVLFQAVYLSEDERQTLASTRVFKMTYPAEYTPSVENYDTAVLSTLTQLTGTAVVAQGLNDETLAKYGCLDPAYEISYTYDGVQVQLLISEKQTEEDLYYVASPLTDIIATVPADTLRFLDWDLIDFIDRSIYSRNIAEIAQIDVQSDTVNASFALTHLRDQTDADKNLRVTETVSGTQITDITNFRNFYRVLLSVQLQDYAPYTEADIETEDLSCALTLRMVTTGGTEITYRFYPYSTRRALYTINGSGEFYVLRKDMQKVIDDCTRVIEGRTVDPEAKS